MNDRDKRIGRIPASVAGLALIVALWASPPARALDEGDFDYWAKAIFSVPIKADWRFQFGQKFSFAEEARRLGDHQQDFGVVYSGLADWIDLGLTLKQKFEKAGEDWERETRPLLNLAIKSTLFGCGVNNRARIAYRDVEDDDAVWRFRHKVRVNSPITFTPWQIRPYVADEIFYEFNAERFNGNRVQAGLFIPLQEQIRLELFYFWHISKEDDRHWSDDNVIGSYLRFKF